LRFGIRPLIPAGLVLVAGGLILYARLPVDGHYFWDLLPAFLISGIGMSLGFIPMAIGALAGVRHSEAGIASGLINTSQQIGGAVGVAVATTVAATYTSRYLGAHSGSAATSTALTRGFEIAFYVLAAVALVGAVASALLVESKPALADDTEVDAEEVVLEAAA
jgi:MFS family permease